MFGCSNFEIFNIIPSVFTDLKTFSNWIKAVMSEKHIYKIIFFNKEQVFEIFAKSVYQGEMYGFVIVEDIVFGEKSAIVLDPGEDKLRAEFEGVNRSFIPMHEIIRIDQVERRGIAKISSAKLSVESKGNVSSLYVPEKK